MGAKRTADLIPLCHPIALDSIQVDLTCDSETQRGRHHGDLQDHRAPAWRWRRSTAVSVAALTVYDMCKAIDRGMRIGDIALQYSRRAFRHLQGAEEMITVEEVLQRIENAFAPLSAEEDPLAPPRARRGRRRPA